MREPMSKEAKAADAAIGMVLLFPYALLNGLVLSSLWRWFAVPLGGPSIGAIHAAGLYSLTRLVIGVRATANDPNPERGAVASIFFGALLLLVIWANAAIFHGMMS